MKKLTAKTPRCQEVLKGLRQLIDKLIIDKLHIDNSNGVMHMYFEQSPFNKIKKFMPSEKIFYGFVVPLLCVFLGVLASWRLSL